MRYSLRVVDETLKLLQQCLVVEGIRQARLRELGWFTYVDDCRALADEDVELGRMDERAFVLFVALRYLAMDDAGNWDGNRTIALSTETVVRNIDLLRLIVPTMAPQRLC